MIVYKGRRFAVRRYKYGGFGIDDTRYADADLIVPTNNGLLYLLSSLKLTLAGQTVEHVNYAGYTTSLLVCQVMHQHITKVVDGCKVGFQISTLMQQLIILNFIHDRGI